MMAGMQLDVFTPLKDSPKTLEQVAEAIEVSPRKLRPLMHALVVAGLLNIDDGLFRNTSEADHFLVKGNPAYMGGMSSLLSFQWSAMLNSAESIKTGVPQSKIDFSVMSEEELEAILRGLQAGAMAAGRELAERHDFSSYRTLADIGGGSGGLAITISEAYPHIKATVIDLPNVTPVTLRIVEEEGGQRARRSHRRGCRRRPSDGFLRCRRYEGVPSGAFARRRRACAQEHVEGNHAGRRCAYNRQCAR